MKTGAGKSPYHCWLQLGEAPPNEELPQIAGWGLGVGQICTDLHPLFPLLTVSSWWVWGGGLWEPPGRSMGKLPACWPWSVQADTETLSPTLPSKQYTFVQLEHALICSTLITV